MIEIGAPPVNVDLDVFKIRAVPNGSELPELAIILLSAYPAVLLSRFFAVLLSCFSLTLLCA